MPDPKEDQRLEEVASHVRGMARFYKDNSLYGPISEFLGPEDPERITHPAKPFLKPLLHAILLDADEAKGSVNIPDRVKSIQALIGPLLIQKLPVENGLRTTTLDEIGASDIFNTAALTRLLVGVRSKHVTERGLSFDEEKVAALLSKGMEFEHVLDLRGEPSVTLSKTDMDKVPNRRLREIMDAMLGSGASDEIFERRKGMLLAGIGGSLRDFKDRFIDKTLLLGDLMDAASRTGITIATVGKQSVEILQGDLKAASRTGEMGAAAIFAPLGDAITHPGAYSFYDVLKAAGVESDGLALAIGLGLDLFTDPLPRLRIGVPTRGLRGPRAVQFNMSINPFNFSKPGMPLYRGESVVDRVERTLRASSRRPLPGAPEFLGQEFFKTQEDIGRFIRGLPVIRRLTNKTGTEVDIAAELALSLGGRESEAVRRAGELLETSAKEAAEKLGVSFEEAYGHVLYAAEKGGARSARNFARAMLRNQVKAATETVKELGKTGEEGLRRLKAMDRIDKLNRTIRALETTPKLPGGRARFGRDLALGRPSVEDVTPIGRRPTKALKDIERTISRESAQLEKLLPLPHAKLDKAKVQSLKKKLLDPDFDPSTEPIRIQANAQGKAWVVEGAEMLRAMKDVGAKKANVIFEHPSPITGPRLEAVRTQMRDMVEAYMEAGYDAKTAVRATRSVVLFDADPAFAPFGAKAALLQERLFRAEQFAGSRLLPLGDADLYYIPRLMRPEAVKLLTIKEKFNLGRFINRWYAKHPSMKQRVKVWEGLPIPEIEGWFRRHKPEIIERFPEGIFETSPEVIFTLRSRRANRIFTSSQFMRENIDHFARKIDDALINEDWELLQPIVNELNLRTHRALGRGVDDVEDLIKSQMKDLKKSGVLEELKAKGVANPEHELRRTAISILKEKEQIAPTALGGALDPATGKRLLSAEDAVVPPEIAAAIRQSGQRWKSDIAGKAVMDMVEKVTFLPLWKAMVTVVFPEFHMRNLMSNAWANYLADVVNPVHYAQALALMADARKGGARIWRFGKWEGTTHDFLTEAAAGRALGFGTFTTEELGAVERGSLFTQPLRREITTSGGARRKESLTRAIVREAGIPAASLALRGLPAFGTQTGRNLGQIFESWGKVTHIIGKLKQGLSLEEAILSAKTYLFDYGDLTPVERVYMKRIVPFYVWCVPDDCEILTREGWKTVDQLAVGEDVLSLNHEVGNSEWVSCEEKAVFSYSGQLMTLRSKRDDFAFTPDHKWPVFQTTKPGEKNRVIKKSYELRSNHSIPRTSIFLGEESVATCREAALIGWIVTDGYMRTRGRHVEMMIYQSPEKHLEKIIDLVGEDGSRGKPHPDSGVVCVHITGELRKRLASLLPIKEDIVSFVCGLGKREARACWQAMIDAGGTIAYEGTTRQHTFFAQRDGPVLDAFQILCQMIGKVAHKSSRGAYVSKEGSVLKTTKRLGTTWYSGRVWCPTTKHGTWLMRRNGRVIWTGNTRKNIPLQLRSLASKPGKIANLKHIREAIQNSRDPNAGPVDTTVVPEWMRARLFAIRPNDDDSITIFNGVGHGIEDLSLFSRPFQEFVGLLNPMMRIPLELPQDHEFLRDAPVTANEIAPSILRHFKHFPGGQDLLDVISYRGVPDKRGEVKYYRADPVFLALWRSFTVTGATTRFGSFLETEPTGLALVGREGQPLPRRDAPLEPLKSLSGLQVRKLNQDTQARNTLFAISDAMEDEIDTLVREGILRRTREGGVVERKLELTRLRRMDRDEFVKIKERRKWAKQLLIRRALMKRKLGRTLGKIERQNIRLREERRR